MKAINFAEKLTKISDFWSPHVIAELNDYQFKVAKIAGEFVWHTHAETDEAFIVLSGSMSILFRDGSVDLKQGEMYVVPKGLEHKPVAASECQILIIEPRGVVNTEGVKNASALTFQNDVWI